MQDWDRLVAVLVGAGVGAFTGYRGWRYLRGGETLAAVGTLLIAGATVVLPLLLAALGG